MQPIDFKLYLITDRRRTKLPLPEAVRQALEGGVRAVQLREKDLSVRDLLAVAQELRDITKEFGARLFVNDRVDVAVAVGADGVHLGQQSMPPEAVRRTVGQEMLVGVSTHSVAEAKAARAGGADFITFGPVFHTESKAGYGKPVGLDPLLNLKKEVDISVFALGGINNGDVDQVLLHGADGVAMISAIFGSDDIRKAAADIINVLS